MSIALKISPISATHGPKISKHFRFGGEKILQFQRRAMPGQGGTILVARYQNVDAKYQFDFE
jgi:hypothetical protein